MNPLLIATARNWIGVFGAAIAVVLGLTACTGTTTQSVTYPKAPSATQIEAITGKQVTIPATDKDTLMIFYSVGCGTCIGITQQIAKIAQDHPDVDYYAVNLDPTEDVRTSNGFLDYINSPHIVGINDTKGTLTKAYSVNSVSTVVVINKDGDIVLNEYEPSPEAIAAAVAGPTT